MSAQRKHGLTIHSKERNIIENVIKCCDEEAEQKYLSVPITKATARAAKYCYVSSRTIQCIRNESNNCVVDGVLSMPNKTWKHSNVR
jgi:protein involved in ribonucleotide reduction